MIGPEQTASATCLCDECEGVRKRLNAHVANGLIYRARAAARVYEALQRAHAHE